MFRSLEQDKEIVLMLNNTSTQKIDEETYVYTMEIENGIRNEAHETMREKNVEGLISFPKSWPRPESTNIRILTPSQYKHRLENTEFTRQKKEEMLDAYQRLYAR